MGPRRRFVGVPGARPRSPGVVPGWAPRTSLEWVCGASSSVSTVSRGGHPRPQREVTPHAGQLRRVHLPEAGDLPSVRVLHFGAQRRLVSKPLGGFLGDSRLRLKLRVKLGSLRLELKLQHPRGVLRRHGELAAAPHLRTLRPLPHPSRLPLLLLLPLGPSRRGSHRVALLSRRLEVPLQPLKVDPELLSLRRLPRRGTARFHLLAEARQRRGEALVLGPRRGQLRVEALRRLSVHRRTRRGRRPDKARGITERAAPNPAIRAVPAHRPRAETLSHGARLPASDARRRRDATVPSILAREPPPRHRGGAPSAFELIVSEPQLAPGGYQVQSLPRGLGYDASLCGDAERPHRGGGSGGRAAVSGQRHLLGHHARILGQVRRSDRVALVAGGPERGVSDGVTTGGRGRRARVGVDPRPAPPRPVVVVHPEDWIHDAVHYGRSKLVHGGVRRGGVFGECGRRVVEHPARHRCSLAPEVLQLASEGLHLAPVRVAPGRGGLRPARGDSLLVPHGRRLEDLTLDLAANLPREPRQGSFGPRRLAHGVPRRAEGPRRGRGGRTSGGGHFIFTAPRFSSY